MNALIFRYFIIMIHLYSLFLKILDNRLKKENMSVQPILPIGWKHTHVPFRSLRSYFNYFIFLSIPKGVVHDKNFIIRFALIFNLDVLKY